MCRTRLGRVGDNGHPIMDTCVGTLTPTPTKCDLVMTVVQLSLEQTAPALRRSPSVPHGSISPVNCLVTTGSAFSIFLRASSPLGLTSRRSPERRVRGTHSTEPGGAGVRATTSYSGPASHAPAALPKEGFFPGRGRLYPVEPHGTAVIFSYEAFRCFARLKSDLEMLVLSAILGAPCSRSQLGKRRCLAGTLISNNSGVECKDNVYSPTCPPCFRTVR